MNTKQKNFTNKHPENTSFSTKYNNPAPYKPTIALEKPLNITAPNPKQFLDESDKNIIYTITNRETLGSSFKNVKFDSEKSQYGRITK